MCHTGSRQEALDESQLSTDRECLRRPLYPSCVLGLVEFGFEEMEKFNGSTWKKCDDLA